MLRVAATGMVQVRKEQVPEPKLAPQKPSKYKLDELDAARLTKHLTVLQPTEAIISDLVSKARRSIPGFAPTAELLRIFRYDPYLMLAIARKAKVDAAAPEGEGLIAFLPLSLLGLQHLALGTFNPAAPDLRLFAKPGERPAGIYVWCVYLPGTLAGGIAFMMERLSAPHYRGVNIHTRAVTEDGRHFCQVLGLKQGIPVGGIEAPENIWTFSGKPQSPLYDSYVPGADKNTVGVTVARTLDDMMRVLSIRNAVYMGEQDRPYDEEFDGNDLSGAHLLAYSGDEPAGSIRIRFFADFAKIERLAVRKEFRKSEAALQLCRASIKFCQKKGYRRISLHSQVEMVDFWKQLGFSESDNHGHFMLSGSEYVELVADIEADTDAVRIGCDPHTIVRPEGRWHKPGTQERSATRGTTIASIVQKR